MIECFLIEEGDLDKVLVILVILLNSELNGSSCGDDCSHDGRARLNFDEELRFFDSLFLRRRLLLLLWLSFLLCGEFLSLRFLQRLDLTSVDSVQVDHLLLGFLLWLVLLSTVLTHRLI